MDRKNGEGVGSKWVVIMERGWVVIIEREWVVIMERERVVNG